MESILKISMRFDIHQNTKHPQAPAKILGVMEWRVLVSNADKYLCFCHMWRRCEGNKILAIWFVLIQLAVIWWIYLDFEMIASYHAKYSCSILKYTGWVVLSIYWGSLCRQSLKLQNHPKSIIHTNWCDLGKGDEIEKLFNSIRANHGGKGNHGEFRLWSTVTATTTTAMATVFMLL